MNLTVKRARRRHRTLRFMRTVPGTGVIWYREVNKRGDIPWNWFFGIRHQRIFDR